ncbi:hypothetical protein DLREEDagrD3_02760 [Denitratisoma sp. agr-D3]
MTTNPYRSLLHRADLAGVYRLPSQGSAPLAAAARDCDYRVFAVDLGAIRDKAGMLAAIAHAFDFPHWFGGNYDGLYDCLSDLGWQPARGYLLLLDHGDTLRSAAAGDFRTLLNLLDEVAADWRQRGVAFWCLVDAHGDGVAELPAMTDGR